MKNRFNKGRLVLLLSGIISLLSVQSVSAQNSGLQYCSITATGTGKTTGEVAALTIYNPSEKEVRGTIGSCIIPSDGSYQPYITLKVIPPIVVPSKGSIDIKLQGYCLDLTKRAATEKDDFKPFSEWIQIDENRTGKIPFFKAISDPDANPELAAPYLEFALSEISKSYDKLKTEGKITTPFSGDPEKEREAVIQQTYWIYTSELRAKPYTKEQFSTRTYEQYQEKANINPINLPADKKQQLDKGIDDFWNTFQAVGTEAKILNQPVKEEPKIITHISGPEVTPCSCTKCEIVTPMKIFDRETNQEITTDSVPWTSNELRFEPPVIKCDCPDKCNPYTSVRIRYLPHFKYNTHSGSLWFFYTIDEIKVWDPGYMEFQAFYKCECANKPCGEGTVTRNIYFTEKNNCCDSIRKRNNGLLRFAFNGGYAQINDNTFWFESKECGYQQFDFDFNLEVIFCNLSDDQVFSYLLNLMQSQLKNGKISEFYSSSSVTMGGVSTDPNMTKYYGFGFSKIINGKETNVFISVDKEKCVFDISLFCNGQMYGYSSPPYLSPAQLMTMGNTLGNPASNQTWVNAMIVLSHLARAHEYNQDTKYGEAFRNFLGMLSTKASGLMQTTNDAKLKEDLKALRDAIVPAIAKGDFTLLHGIADKIIPVLNATN